MEKIVDEPLLKITAGMAKVIHCLVTVLVPAGSLDHMKLEVLAQALYDQLPADDLESIPLALLLRHLRPNDPPPPVLRLVKG